MVSHSTHLWLVFFVFLAVAVFGGLFLGTINPEAATLWQFALVYFLVFLWIYAAALMIGYGVRKLFWRKNLGQDFLRPARRQAVLFGFLAVFMLMLESADLFNLKTAVPLVIIFVLIELYAQ